MDERDDFLAEIAMMKRVGRHDNIVVMLACITQSQPYSMVLEYVPHGDLLHYLRALRAVYQQWKSIAKTFTKFLLMLLRFELIGRLGQGPIARCHVECGRLGIIGGATPETDNRSNDIRWLKVVPSKQHFFI